MKNMKIIVREDKKGYSIIISTGSSPIEHTLHRGMCWDKVKLEAHFDAEQFGGIPIVYELS